MDDHYRLSVPLLQTQQIKSPYRLENMKVKTLVKRILRKMLNPKNALTLIRIQRDKKKKTSEKPGTTTQI
jgi:hypothetical protein